MYIIRSLIPRSKSTILGLSRPLSMVAGAQLAKHQEKINADPDKVWGMMLEKVEWVCPVLLNRAWCTSLSPAVATGDPTNMFRW
mmetsp:Transcript_8051/g.11059  ORF Transcript_8051/g.11059 Transcript_8051/m.11059 type:complete len:84 (+) Transcript_8051:79-330(+)